MSESKVYSLHEITLRIAGIPIEGGGAGEDEFISIPESTDWSYVVGAGGEVAISRNNDQTAEISIFLLQTASGNDLLSALRARQIAGPGLPGAGPFFMRDRNGRSLYEGAVCVILGSPEASFGSQAKTREWKIFVPHLRRFVGGNLNIGGPGGGR